MKIRNFDKATDNYYDKGVMVIQKYKTANVYGKYTVDLKKRGPEFNKILKKWVEINPTDWLLYGTTQRPLTASQMTHMSNKLWEGKKVSVDMYRHSYITNFYHSKEGMPTLADMEQLAREMAHSVVTNMEYVKNDMVDKKQSG